MTLLGYLFGNVTTDLTDAEIIESLERSADSNVRVYGEFESKEAARSAVEDWFDTAESALATMRLPPKRYDAVWKKFQEAFSWMVS